MQMSFQCLVHCSIHTPLKRKRNSVREESPGAAAPRLVAGAALAHAISWPQTITLATTDPRLLSSVLRHRSGLSNPPAADGLWLSGPCTPDGFQEMLGFTHAEAQARVPSLHFPYGRVSEQISL